MSPGRNPPVLADRASSSSSDLVVADDLHASIHNLNWFCPLYQIPTEFELELPSASTPSQQQSSLSDCDNYDFNFQYSLNCAESMNRQEEEEKEQEHAAKQQHAAASELPNEHSLSTFSPQHQSQLLPELSVELPQSSLPLKSASIGREHSSILSRQPSISDTGSNDAQNRVVFINNPEKTNDLYEFSGNKVRTSKYTIFSFLPKNLFEQFHRVAYIYFLVIILLDLLPRMQVFEKSVAFLPLTFVLVVTACKDVYEDWRRHRSDIRENNRSALVFQDGQYVTKPWKSLRVGEMVKIQANETIPCDLVLLRTSDPNGVAFVQTTNLDGESNLKTRCARLETAELLSTADKMPMPSMITGKVVCEKPNRNIYGFVGCAEIDGKQLPLGPSNIILRGCELKNTSWAIGVVVYAGQETKAMLNSAGAQSKRSRLEHCMNGETLWLSVFLLVTCLIGGLGTAIWLKLHSHQLDYSPYYGKQTLTPTRKDFNYAGFVGEAIIACLSFVIIFQTMIPISLYISMELVRVGQAYFMVRDAEMYHTESSTKFQCRALNINEDLGQIKYVFSDKTGTLTENKMEFRNASIFGQNYCNPQAKVAAGGDIEGIGWLTPEDEQVLKEVLGKLTWKPKAAVKVDPQLVQLLQVSDEEDSQRKAVHDYLLTLAACNTVVPTKTKVTPSGKLEIELALAADEGTCLVEYHGESPDEQALVSAAASYGYTLLERTSNYVVINILGQIQRFLVLGLHEFDSVRKCMSMIIQCPDGSVKVLVKGADTSVLQKIALLTGNTQLEEARQAQIMFNTKRHLDLYSREGLRTLVVATRDLSTAELKHWQKLYAEANASLVDRAGMLQEVAEVVEKDLLLRGATGIEDKLQSGVPETIAALREAGIKVWMLTGDKQETAISVGFSAALLTDDMKQIIVNESVKELCQEALIQAKAAHLSLFQEMKSFTVRQKSLKAMNAGHQRDAEMSSELLSVTTATSLDEHYFSCASTIELNSTTKAQSLALIIDGNTLVHALDDDLEQELFDLATACEVVICCRVAPLQKAGIVSLIKRKSHEMTLAIGDGANDVSMIQMADVGVGISGQEGRQAVLASDFSMGQFRFLRRMLFVHGHLNYRRLGYMVLYNFYRNAVLVMMLFWYIFYTAFSASSAIADWNLSLYSLIYTSVPTILVGILDKDVNYETLLKYPGLYKGGQQSESNNRTLFWLTMLDTLWQSLVLFYVPVLSYQQSTMDIWGMGSIWIISVVMVVNVHLAMDIECWTWIFHLAIWGSIAVTFVSVIIVDFLTDNISLTQYWVTVPTASTYWLTIFLIVCLALLPRFIFKVLQQRFWPSDIQIAKEEENLANMVVPH